MAWKRIWENEKEEEKTCNGNENRFAQLIQNASDGMHSITECKHGSSHLAGKERRKKEEGANNNSNSNKDENYILRSVSCY